jgi:hypothetical protein
MDTFMIVARFKSDTDLRGMFAVVPEELAQVEVLRAENRVGAVHISRAGQRVFIEVFADTEAEAAATVATLPMSPWWDVEIYATDAPPAAPQ